MQRHCKEHHNWANDWKKGGNIKAKLQEPRQLPWITGVWCQRLFRSRAASSWFEVKSTANIGFSIVENKPTANKEDNDEDNNQAAICMSASPVVGTPGGVSDSVPIGTSGNAAR